MSRAIAEPVMIDSEAALPAVTRKRALDPLALLVEVLAVAAIVVNIFVTFGNALVRFVTQQDFPWSADLWRVLIAMIAFLGAPAYFRRTHGMAYTAVVDMLHGSRREVLQASGLLVLLGVCLTALAPFPTFFAAQRAQTLPILGIDSGYVAIWLGAGLVLMSVFTLEKLAALRLTAIAVGALVPILIVVATLTLRWAYAQGHADWDPFLMIVPVLALAGNLASKKLIPPSAGSFPVANATFVLLLVGTIMIVAALNFFPALALGPIVEQFLMKGGAVY